MPMIGIYVPSIGIKSGFRPGFGSCEWFRGVRAGGGRLAVFSNRGEGLMPTGLGRALRAFKTVFRGFEWVGEGV